MLPLAVVVGDAILPPLRIMHTHKRAQFRHCAAYLKAAYRSCTGSLKYLNVQGKYRVGGSHVIKLLSDFYGENATGFMRGIGRRERQGTLTSKYLVRQSFFMQVILKSKFFNNPLRGKKYIKGKQLKKRR